MFIGTYPHLSSTIHGAPTAAGSPGDLTPGGPTSPASDHGAPYLGRNWNALAPGQSARSSLVCDIKRSIDCTCTEEVRYDPSQDPAREIGGGERERARMRMQRRPPGQLARKPDKSRCNVHFRQGGAWSRAAVGLQRSRISPKIFPYMCPANTCRSPPPISSARSIPAGCSV